MNNQTARRLCDSDIVDIVDIFRNFDAQRVSEVFRGSNLLGMHEFLVDIFRESQWSDPACYMKRNTLLLTIGMAPVTPDQHRALFLAIAESGESVAAGEYLDMLGGRNQVRLADRKGLFSAIDLHALMAQVGLGIAGNVDLLINAMTPDHCASIRALWGLMRKLHEPRHEHAGKWLTAMQVLVCQFGLHTTGLGVDDVDNEPWISLFFNGRDQGTVQIAGSVLASQLARNYLTTQTLIDRACGLGDQMRLIKTFDLSPHTFSFQVIRSSHAHRAPDYVY
ncbi:hypothetical protein IFT48_00985 [Pseudomonas fluorescens]|uniref:hypothetical protein n=1 Tax=Pseudomonas fluorescens TaxID=294 RepID=UPI0019309DBD|nr:hypothetical protein [Pseudomonas fluorescens]MBD8088567.1 hypothetical protein [Pseudomonas fluorescens]